MSVAIPSRIPVYEPVLSANEERYLLDAFRTRDLSGSGGYYLDKFERDFAAYLGVKHAVATSSGTTALHLAASVLDIGPDDDVLVSAFTNIATANAFVTRGARIIPVDSEPLTWNLDAGLADQLVTGRTRAIAPVHIYGNPVDMNEVWALAINRNLYVIEDAAEAHGAEWEGQKVGSFGDIGCFSFYANKVITTGEGGMLVTGDDGLAARARLLRNLAFSTPRFYHREVGYNYRLTNLQAAIGCAQLEEIDSILARKRHVAETYTHYLSQCPAPLRLPVERENTRNIYWMYCVVFDSNETRGHVAHVLSQHGIETRTMFCPLNLQPALHAGGRMLETDCPVAEELWQCGLYLPSSPRLRDEDIEWICHVITARAL